MRLMAAKSIKDSRKAVISMLVILMPIAALVVASGGWVGKSLAGAGVLPEMEPDTAFTLGLFSLLDAMLDMPIDEVCARVNLPKELTQAITENAGPYGKHLKALLQWEKGAADAIDWASLDVSPGELEASIEQAIHTVSHQSGDLSL